MAARKNDDPGGLADMILWHLLKDIDDGTKGR